MSENLVQEDKAQARDWSKLWNDIVNNLNFFRLHVLFFTFTPLIFSGIFYAANGSTHIPYIDALFVCFSAGTVCGLATIDLSSLTGFQQAILFVQAAIGNPVVVSWVMVYIRRRFFNKKLQYIVEAEIEKRKALAEQRARERKEQGQPVKGNLMRQLTRAFTSYPTRHSRDGKNDNDSGGGDQHGHKVGEKRGSVLVRPEDIRRTTVQLKRVDPNGVILDSIPENEAVGPESTVPSQSSTLRNDGNGYGLALITEDGIPFNSDPESAHTHTHTHNANGHNVTFQDQLLSENGHDGARVDSPGAASSYRSLAEVIPIVHDDRAFIPPGGAPVRRRTTVWTRSQTLRYTNDGNPVHDPLPTPLPATKNRGYGGFPYPTTLLYRLLKKKAVPGMRRGLERTKTLLPERTRSIIERVSTRHSEKNDFGAMNAMKYFSDSFNALIGRNSKFYDLTEDNLEELGGVEYRALNALLWIIAVYHFMVHLISFTIIAPYLSLSRWAPVFSPPNLHKTVSPVWYSAFQAVSAYTTLGMSLVDQSMVPFQEAYPLIFVCTFLIMAGNLAFPIFLRFFIWIIAKLSPSNNLRETLDFLLDHPRRCYIYLFPSHQTWLLLGVVLLLNGMDWFFFLVLNIGIDAYEAIPLGVRFAIGVLQSTSARGAGFATMSISALAPALQILFVIVMYLGVYPIALSIQATNVYEEKSLGVFEDEDEDDEAEPKVDGDKPSSVGRYIAWHARRQLSFDMWFLGVVLFLLCIIERGKIRNSDNFEWFTIFALIFEIISAYSGVGMSMGVPYANFSFCGAFTKLSKLIIIVVMVRGRHRGLPVAIDRAVMLPFEFKKSQSVIATGAGAYGYVQGQGQGQGRGQGEGATDNDDISVINRLLDENGEFRKKRK